MSSEAITERFGQLGGIERLDHVVVGPELEGALAVVVAVMATEHDRQRRPIVRSERLEHLEAVHPGHAEIEHEGIDRLLGEGIERRRPIGRGVDLEADLLESDAKQRSEPLLVVGDEHPMVAIGHGPHLAIDIDGGYTQVDGKAFDWR